MARDSVYGRLLGASKVPEWVFGGEYGDISNTLNKREMGYEQLQAQELQNEQNQIKAEQQQKQLEFGNRIGDIFSTDGAPKSLGDMYKAQIGAALDTGNPIMAAKLQEELLQYNDDERRKKAQEFSSVAQLADKISPSVLAPQHPDFPQSEMEKIYNEARVKKPGASRAEKPYKMRDPETGVVQLIPESQVNDKAQAGWKFDNSNPLEFLMQAMNSGEEGNAIKPGEAPAAQQKVLVKDIQGKAAASNQPPSRPITATNPKTGKVVTWNEARQVWE